MSPDPVSLAQALIRCRSVTPDDGGALDLLAGHLSAAGFAVDLPVFSEPGTPPIRNLYARIGNDRPCIVFAGHTDVVPPGDPAAWTDDPFAGTIRDGYLFGRGAADMKGGVAASVAAALRFVDRRGSDFGGSIAFLITGDEEGPAVNGTVKLLAWTSERSARFDACLLGEPTNPERLGDSLKIGRRGSLTVRVTVSGRQGHVAYPHLAINPVPHLARVVTALAETPLDAGTAHFDASTLAWTTLDVGNPATNVVPAEARGTFNIRFNDLWTADTLADEVRRRVASVPGEAAVSLVFAPSNSPAFLTTPGPWVETVRAAVEAETGRSPALSTSGGTSDARFIAHHCPVVEFGLVGATMHGIDEHVATADIEALARIYGRVLESSFPAGASAAGP